VLAVAIVRFLAALSLAALVFGFALGHWLAPRSREVVRVVARREPGRGTEVAWIAGALVAALWPIGVLLAPAYAYGWPGLPDFPYSPGIQVGGWVVSLCGGLLFFASARALGRHMTPAIQLGEGHRLVQEGPYRYIRHPVYTAIVSGAIGESVAYLSPVLASLTLVLAGLAAYRARLEEDLLGSPEAFGEVYAQYRARTGRFLPRVRSKP